MKTITLVIGAVYGLLSVILGAFGAHGLKRILPAEKIETFEVGVKYQIYAALFLLIVGYILKFETGLEKWISLTMIFGIFLFSFSIYGLSFNGYNGMNFKFLGPITPLGGIMMVISWALLIVYFIKNKG